MLSRAGLLAAGLLCLASSACGGDVDLVADTPPDEPPDEPGRLRDVMTAEPCEAGEYRGSFKSTHGLVPLEGRIIVTLSLYAEGEFFRLDRTSTLEAPIVSTGATVSATVVGDGSCTTGHFAAKIENGEYRVPGDTQPPVTFTGDVSGTYQVTQERGPALFGEWSTFIPELPPDQPISAGTWMAVLAVPSAAQE